MIPIVISILLAYVLGLAFAGYVCVLWVLSKANWNKNIVVRTLIGAIHFGAGIGGMVIVPAYLYGKFKSGIPENAGVAFGLTLILSLAVAFLFAREINRISK